jgi:hypothetical protein
MQVAAWQLAWSSWRNRQPRIGALAADDGFDFQNTSGHLNFGSH